MIIHFSSKMDDACNEGTGFIEVYVSGGVAPYTFVWSNGYTSSPDYISRDSGLIAGTYTVTVYDAASDSATNSFAITNYPDLNRGGTINFIFSAVNPITQSSVDHPCPGDFTGHMYGHLELVSGTPPYGAPGIMSIWNPVTGFMNPNVMTGITTGPFGEILEVYNLAAYDQFTVATSDAMGCPASFSDQMYGPDPFNTLSITAIAACNSGANGTVILNYPGGNNWPLSVIIYDSTTNAVVYNNSFIFPPQQITNTLFAGTYRVNIAYQNTISLCDTDYYFTVIDAGTSCGNISGKVYLDSIRNCVADASEPGLPSQFVKITPGPLYATTDSLGNYSLIVPYGTYTITHDLNAYHPNFTVVCNPAPVTINGVAPNATANMGDSANVEFDLSVGFTSLPARPGFNMHYVIKVENHSFLPSTNTLLSFNVDPSLVFVSCNYAYTDLGGGSYSVQLPSVGQFQRVEIEFVFSVPASAVIGSVLNANATVTDSLPEVNTSNNFFALSQLVQGSFDPNDKSVLPSNDPNNTYFIDIDSMFTYTIRFQNTGTDSAFNIRVVDSLSQYLDISTLEIKAASHPFTWQLKGIGILEFDFDNILLPDSNTNEEASHGSVTYTISPLSTVPLLTVIPNYASIYFDFNAPVNTNTITSVIDVTVGMNELHNDHPFSIVPNPTNDLVKITLKDELRNNFYDLKIFNLQGQNVIFEKNVSDQSIVSLKELNNGCYFYQLENEGKIVAHSQGKILVNK